MAITHTRQLVVVVLMALLLPALAACGITSTPDPCAPPAITATLTKLLDADREFSDTVTTASSTARIELAPVLLSMQKTKRETEDIAVPPCVESAKAQLLLYMNNAIEGFSKFARQANDYEFYMNEAGKTRTEFAKEIEKLTPTPTP